MRLTESNVAIRPRSPWEAIDLGVLLAGRHRGLLMSSWAIVTLPVFCLLSALLWDYPTAAILLFWWLKPAFERLSLLILSQSLFGATPTLGQALKAWPATLKSQLLPSLLWRRLSLSRTFSYRCSNWSIWQARNATCVSACSARKTCAPHGCLPSSAHIWNTHCG